MPKETIHQAYPDGDQPFQVSVGWQRDQDVQVGIQVQDETSTLLDHLYGGQLDQLESLGDAAYRWLARTKLEDLESTLGDKTACQEMGAEVLDWVEGSRLYHPERDGIWVTMGRFAINEAIRHLRKARDTAYGRDE